MAAYKLGENAKLYYSATLAASLTYTVPTTTADNIKDVKVTHKHDTPDASTRANGGIKQYAVSMTDMGVTFMMKVPAVGVTDAAYTAIRTAHINKAEIEIFALTDLTTVSGAEGPAGNFVVSDFSIEEGNGTVLFASVELKPSTFNSWYIAP